MKYVFPGTPVEKELDRTVGLTLRSGDARSVQISLPERFGQAALDTAIPCRFQARWARSTRSKFEPVVLMTI